MENKIDKFLYWLGQETEYGDWHDNVKAEVRAKLIEIMSEKSVKEHRWEFYANGSFCKDCRAQLGSGQPCR